MVTGAAEWKKKQAAKRKGIAVESNIVGSGATVTALNAAPPPTMGTNDLNAPPIPPTSGPPIFGTLELTRIISDLARPIEFFAVQ